jgi:hypothetical protein
VPETISLYFWFSGDNVDCWMEIQHGKGPWASPVSGIVPLGTTLTMVVGINDKQGEFFLSVTSRMRVALSRRQPGQGRFFQSKTSLKKDRFYSINNT